MFYSLGSMISNKIGEIFWGLASGVFKIIELLGQAFQYLAGMSPDDKNNSLLDSLVNGKEINKAYFFIMFIAIGIMMICLIVGLIKAQYNKEQPQASKKVITNTLKATIFFAIIPLVCIIFVSLVGEIMNIICNGTSNIFSSATTETLNGLGEHNNLGANISQGIFEASMKSSNLGFGAKWWYGYSTLNDDFSMGLNAGGSYNYVLSILIGCIILWALLMTTISLVERIINLILLYISAPMVIATSSLDEGARFGIWKDKILSKYLGVMGNILSMIIYLYLASWISDSDNMYFNNEALGLFIKCIVLIGGSFMCAKGNVLIAGLISHNEASQEGLSQQQSNAMLHGGMALGGAVLMGGSRRASQLAGANGGLGSGSTSPNLSGGGDSGVAGATATKGLGIGSKIKGGLGAVRNKGLIGAGAIVLGKTIGAGAGALNPLRFRRNNEEFKQHVGEKLLKGKELSKHEDKRMDRLANKEGRANAQKEYEKKNLERGQSLLERRAGGVQAYRQYDLEEKGRKGSAL